LRINNLLDEEYSENGTQFFTSSGSVPAFFPSPERNFWLSAKVSF
jgi:outer membrane receptor protein involved in Fe transport